jgi:hypothetical protein
MHACFSAIFPLITVNYQSDGKYTFTAIILHISFVIRKQASMNFQVMAVIVFLPVLPSGTSLELNAFYGVKRMEKHRNKTPTNQKDAK